MNLRAYASNSPELNEFFEKEEGGKIPQMQKLLRILWDTSTDEFLLSLPQKPPDHTKWTKRKILKEIASIYDPLGFFSPSTLLGKLFLQSLWKSNLGWDDTLPAEKEAERQQLIDQWTIPALKIDRMIVEMGNESTSKFDLHVFTDTSATAYCAVAYLVQDRRNSPHKVSLIMSKSRLAPLHQSITISRLELSVHYRCKIARIPNETTRRRDSSEIPMD
ncbi:hypothetical protein RB195_022864 [Necator americanus]|uniref:Pao retrotransposon peptidase n=1 Tax=Necator americanus TaxID=51031 RepID=A0ABR1EGW3_NECAM